VRVLWNVWGWEFGVIRIGLGVNRLMYLYCAIRNAVGKRRKKEMGLSRFTRLRLQGEDIVVLSSL